jgi:hypothetical protein
MNASAEPEIVATAVPAGVASSTSGNEPPIPPGHSRFYCHKCHTVRASVQILSREITVVFLLVCMISISS